MLNNLTMRQAQVLDFLKAFISRNGYSPSVREIATAMKWGSSSTAHAVLEQLERKGVISKEGGPRTIRVIREKDGDRIEKIIECCGQIGEYDDDDFTPPPFINDLEGDEEDNVWDWISMMLKASARKAIDTYLDE